MSHNKRPEPGTKEFYEWVQARAQKEMDDAFAAGPANFDERGLISGGPETARKSDAELFPDEIEEYTPEERKPKLVSDNRKLDEDDK